MSLVHLGLCVSLLARDARVGRLVLAILVRT